MNLIVVGALGLLLVAVAAALIRARDLFATMALVSAFSLLIAVVMAAMGAVDVAFTEAVVGASFSTILFMTLLRRIDPKEILRPRPVVRTVAIAGVATLGAALLQGVHALPPFGDPGATPATRVAPEFVRRAVGDSATPNVVTAVLADYRGFDTLIETAVILTAAMACILLLARKP